MSQESDCESKIVPVVEDPSACTSLGFECATVSGQTLTWSPDHANLTMVVGTAPMVCLITYKPDSIPLSPWIIVGCVAGGLVLLALLGWGGSMLYTWHKSRATGVQYQAVPRA